MALIVAADPLGSLVQYLLRQDDLNDFTGGRIYGGRLPAKVVEQVISDPRPLLAIRYIGGLGDPYTIKIMTSRVEFRMYGQREADLFAMFAELYRLLNDWENTVLEDNTRILSVSMDGGFTDFPDPDVHGPVGITRATVIAQRLPC